MKRLLIITVLYGSGTGLLWWGTSWMAVLGVFILLWASRAEDRFNQSE